MNNLLLNPGYIIAKVNRSEACVPLMPSVLINENGARMKAFLQQSCGGFEHPFKAVTRPEFSSRGQGESGPKT